MTGIVPGARSSALVWQDGPRLTLEGRNPRDHNLLVEAITAGRVNSVIIPIIEAIDQRLMSRFLAKVSLEVLAQRVLNVDGWQDEVVDNAGLDAIRHFARVGDRPREWPFSRRRIYGEEDVQKERHGAFQVLHEFTLLYEPLPQSGHANQFAVVCIFGEEFAINMGEPEIASYERWLKLNGGRSPLYLSDTLPIPPVFC